MKKSYNSNLILNGISLQINRGEIFSLLGPDESGKTTLMEILVGLKKPSEGSVEISGYNIQNKIQMSEIKKIIGFLPQEFRTHDNLTVKENIQYWGKFYDKRLGLEEILSIFKLTDYLKVPYKKLPSNLKRKLGLAIAFINDNSLRIPVSFTVTNNGDLMPGMFLEAYLMTNPKEKAIVVPYSALLEEQGKYFVYVEIAGESFMKRQVTIAGNDGLNAEISSGLKPGERVVTKGVQAIKLSSMAAGLPLHGHTH